MMTKASRQPQLRTSPGTGAAKLRVYYGVEGNGYYVDIGINLISADIDSMDKTIAPMKLRAAIKSSLTEPVMVKYEGGHAEQALVADAITDTIIARIRETL